MQKIEKDISQTSQEKQKYAIGASAVSMAGFALAAEEASNEDPDTDVSLSSQAELEILTVEPGQHQSSSSATTIQSPQGPASILAENPDSDEPVIITIEDIAEDEVLEAPSYETSDVSTEIEDYAGNIFNDVELISEDGILPNEGLDISFISENVETISDPDCLIADQYADNTAGDLIEDIDLNNAEFI